MEYRYFYGHSVISSSLTGLTVTYMHENTRWLQLFSRLFNDFQTPSQRRASLRHIWCGWRTSKAVPLVSLSAALQH